MEIFRSLSTTLVTSKMSSAAAAAELFTGTTDMYKGVTVRSNEEPCPDRNIFEAKLVASLEKWKKTVRSLKLP